MKKKLLIVGVNSLLYEIFKFGNFKDYDAISHKEVNEIDYNNYEIFLAFAKNGIENLFVIDSMSSMKDSEKLVPYFFEDGIGLPEKSYYFDKDKKEIREKYQELIVKLFKYCLPLLSQR